MAKTTRIDLKDGQWIDVKNKLKVRDEEDQLGYASLGINEGGKSYNYNIKKHATATAAIYIVNWFVKDEDGNPIPWPAGKSKFSERTEVVRNLDADIFDPITEAVKAHHDLMSGEGDDEKKETPSGETSSGPSSPSAS